MHDVDSGTVWSSNLWWFVETDSPVPLLLGVKGGDEYGEIIKKRPRDVNIAMKLLMTAYNSHPIDCLGEWSKIGRVGIKAEKSGEIFESAGNKWQFFLDYFSW